jgi:hypothetical protein
MIATITAIAFIFTFIYAPYKLWSDEKRKKEEAARAHEREIENTMRSVKHQLRNVRGY